MTSSKVVAVVTLVVLAVGLAVTLAVATPLRDGSVSAKAARAAVRSDFTEAQRDHARQFHRRIDPWSYGVFAVGLLVTVLLGLTPLGATLVELVAKPLGGGWAWQAVLGGWTVGLIGQLATLPLSARAETISRHYGLSTQSWGGWWLDLAKSWLIGAVLSAAILLGFYAMVRAAPRWWWAPVAAGAAALVFALSFAYPLWVEPLFNKFTPMAASPLRTELLTLAKQDGVPVRDVLVADASRRTSALNAYVSGFGATRRIVVYDTLLHTAPDSEVTLVVAHELGHAKRNDVLFGTTVAALGAAAAACAAYLLFGWAPLLRRAGVSELGDARSVALVFAVVALGALLALPLQNAVSRRIEARADLHSLRLTHDPSGFVDMQRRLALTNLSNPSPNPLAQWMFGSHPSTGERLAFARKFARERHLEVAQDNGGR